MSFTIFCNYPYFCITHVLYMYTTRQESYVDCAGDLWKFTCLTRDRKTDRFLAILKTLVFIRFNFAKRVYMVLYLYFVKLLVLNYFIRRQWLPYLKLISGKKINNHFFESVYRLQNFVLIFIFLPLQDTKHENVLFRILILNGEKGKMKIVLVILSFLIKKCLSGIEKT